MARQQLPPGFRFHPTDEELVLQYLRRKALSRPLPAAVIPVVHAAALPDPWDLPDASEGEEAYFFSLRQAPARGGRRRRATSGHWKAMGKEKPVFVQLQGPSGKIKRLLVGVKTALAFHRGKARSTRTDWVMHEYRLAGTGAANDLQSCEWVVCRVSLKSRARRASDGDAGSEKTAVVHREDDAGDQHQPSPSSSSCVTETCHASDHQDEVSSTAIVLGSSSIKTMLAPATSCMLPGGGGGSKEPLNRHTRTRRLTVHDRFLAASWRSTVRAAAQARSYVGNDAVSEVVSRPFKYLMYVDSGTPRLASTTL